MKVLPVLLMLLSLHAFAQNPEETIMESVALQTDPEEYMQDLQMLKEHPPDLNFASQEELCVAGLFTPGQAMAVILHREQYGKFIAFEELQAIPGFDISFLQRIRPYCVVGERIDHREWHIKKLMDNGKHTLLWRQRKSFPGSNENDFDGDPNRINFSWRFISGKLVDIGINGDKDGGEVMLRKGRYLPFDSWNYHIVVRPGGKVKMIALGDYQVNSAQGLVAWTGFAGSKSSEVLNTTKMAPVIRPYASFGEFGLYRGAAVVAATHSRQIAVWVSSRKHDSDSDGETFRTIRTDGYHRDSSEISRSKNLRQDILGANICLNNHRLRHQFTLQGSRYNAERVPGNNSYQYYEPAGRSFINASYGFNVGYRNLSFAGEIASDRNKNAAVVLSSLIALDPKIAFTTLFRDLRPGYQSFSASPFRENSQPTNERGVYCGLQWQVRNGIRFNSYLDIFRFPWLRYRVSQPSWGKEWMMQLNWTPARHSEFYIRFRQQVKPINVSGDYAGIEKLQDVLRNNLRVDARLKLNRNLFYQVRTEWTDVYSEVRSQGWLFMQELDVKPMGKSWSFTLRYNVFNTVDYDTRIYAFQQDLPGSFSLPAFYGRGSSASLLLRLGLYRGLDLWIRSGYQPGVYKEGGTLDQGIQLRYIF